MRQLVAATSSRHTIRLVGPAADPYAHYGFDTDGIVAASSALTWAKVPGGPNDGPHELPIG